MKRFITNILIFFIIVGMIDVSVGGLGNFLQHHAKGGEFRMFDDLVLRDRHDIIILGSSRAHCHYDAPFMSENLDLDVYNAGYDGNGVVLSVGIMEMILDRYQPRLIVFDVEPAFDIEENQADNNHKRYLHRLKPYFNQPGVERIFKEISMEEWLKVHSGMMRYNTVIVPLAIDNVFNRGTEDRGYGPAIGEMKEDRQIKSNISFKKDEFKIKYIHKLISLTQKHGVKLMVVASPKYGMTSSDIFNPVKAMCLEEGIPFLDYYQDTTFVNHKELFKEPVHLNNQGARLFSQRIIKDIEGYINN